MIGKFFRLLAALVAAALLITLAIANRHATRLVLDPFNPQSPVISLEMPFYIYLFAMLIVGVALGGFTTWMTQGKWRRLARTRTQDSMRWKGEAERLMRERDAGHAEKKQLMLARR